MAKLEQGILGPFRGKVGTVVGYMWRGLHVVRAYRREINYPNTEKQQAERQWFVEMVRFAATARKALLLGMKEKAAQWRMTEGNAFVKMNKGNFGLTPGPSPTGEGGVDYERLTISCGSAAPVLFRKAVISEDGILEVAFEKNSGMSRAKGSDRVYLYIYNTETREGLLPAAAERRSGRLRIQLPDGWNHQNTKLWGFVVDGDGRASTSAYVPLADGEPEAHLPEEAPAPSTPENNAPASTNASAQRKNAASYIVENQVFHVNPHG